MGRYVNRTLLNGEAVVFETHLHRILYLAPVLLVIFGIGCASSNAALGGSLIVLGGLLFMGRMIRRATSEYVVTNKRVVIKTGIVSRKTLEMMLSKVESVDVQQGIVARILGFGRILVVGTGGSREPFSMIARPIEFRRAVQTQQAP